MKNILKNNTFLVLFLISIAIVLSLLLYSRDMIGESSKLLLSVAEQHLILLSKSATLLTDVDELSQIHTAEDTEKPVYMDLKNRLSEFSSEWNLAFTYYMRLMPDGRLQYIADNITDLESDDLDGPDSFIEPGDPLYDAPRKAFEGITSTVGIFVPDVDGLMAAYSPIYSLSGDVVAIAGVDFYDEEFTELRRKTPLLIVLQFIMMVIATIAGFIGVMLYRNKARMSTLASQAKSNFLANMSHEIRTPMNAITGMTAIAKASNDIKQKDYCLDKIEDASAHLLGIINDILDMSKIEANKFELSETEFGFEKMLQKALSIVHFRVAEKHQTVTVSIDKNIPYALIGDEQHLRQVVTNLLSNAVKFTPDEGSIVLSAYLISEENDICTIKIEVSDTGIGVSEEQKKHLFSSFQQGDNSISRKFGGTGLGLAISKNIVQMMGGEIWVDSNKNKGSVFAFTAKLKRGLREKPDILKKHINRENMRILVVDDMPDTREYFEGVSAQLEIKCDTVSTSERALELIKNNGPYDMYFIDWRMPGINGIELSKMIRNSGDLAVIVIISSSEWNIIETEAKDIANVKYLSKPIFKSDVVDIINESAGNGGSNEKKEDKNNKASFKGKKMLLVDDISMNAEILMAVLKSTDIEIEYAKDGIEALKMFKENPDRYDIIFMDIQMPGMDGYEVTKFIREIADKKAQTIPIIAMTANAYKEDVDKALQSGMNGHLAKPIDIDAVMKVLEKYLS